MPPVGMKSAVAAALPGTIHEIAKKSGLAESTIRRWLRELRENNAAHISRWNRQNGLPTPFYAAGPGKDRPAPKARTSAQYSKKWRAARRKERIEREEARAEADEFVRQAASTPKTWASSLLGPSC